MPESIEEALDTSSDKTMKISDLPVEEGLEIKRKAAQAAGLPEVFSDRISGETQEDLVADARRLAGALAEARGEAPAPEGPKSPELRALALMFAKQAESTRRLLEPSLTTETQSESPGVLPPIQTTDPDIKIKERGGPVIDEGE